MYRVYCTSSHTAQPGILSVCRLSSVGLSLVFCHQIPLPSLLLFSDFTDTQRKDFVTREYAHHIPRNDESTDTGLRLSIYLFLIVPDGTASLFLEPGVLASFTSTRTGVIPHLRAQQTQHLTYQKKLCAASETGVTPHLRAQQTQHFTYQKKCVCCVGGKVKY